MPLVVKQLDNLDDEHNKKFLQLLRDNPRLLENIALYIVRTSGVKLYAYENYLTFESPSYLEASVRLNGRSFRFTKKPEKAEGPNVGRWHMQLAEGVNAPLPSASAVDFGLYLSTGDLPLLLKLRRRVAAELAQFDVWGEIARSRSADEELLWVAIVLGFR